MAYSPGGGCRFLRFFFPRNRVLLPPFVLVRHLRFSPPFGGGKGERVRGGKGRGKLYEWIFARTAPRWWGIREASFRGCFEKEGFVIRGYLENLPVKHCDTPTGWKIFHPLELRKGAHGFPIQTCSLLSRIIWLRDCSHLCVFRFHLRLR